MKKLTNQNGCYISCLKENEYIDLKCLWMPKIQLKLIKKIKITPCSSATAIGGTISDIVG